MLDDGGDAVGRRLGRLAVMAVDDQRRAAFADVGGREARGVGDRDEALMVRAAGRSSWVAAGLEFLDQREDSFRRLRQAALSNQPVPKTALPGGLVITPW